MLIRRTLWSYWRWAGVAAALALAAGCAGPRIVSAPDDRIGAGAGRAPVRTVVVGKGDSLYRIARRHGVSTKALIALNGVRPPYVIHPGQRLRLPAKRVHVVRRGESLRRIADRYGVSVSGLARANGIGPPYRIHVGQRLRVTDTRSAAAPKPARGRAAKRAPPRPRPVALGKPPRRASGRFLWPVAGPVAVGFGPRGGGLHNDGINILAKRGTAVRAAENGIVAYSGNEIRGFGNLILIKHADGWMSAYAHNQTLLVRAGQKVKRGQTISRVGSSGNVQRPQVHFELRRGRRVVDPMRYLGPPPRAVSGLDPASSPASRRSPG